MTVTGPYGFVLYCGGYVFVSFGILCDEEKTKS